jgi:hypothetical protein
MSGLAIPLRKERRLNTGADPLGSVLFNVRDANNNAVGCELTEAEADALVASCNRQAVVINALRAAAQCIGELPPTQARVETFQMVQAAIAALAPE